MNCLAISFIFPLVYFPRLFAQYLSNDAELPNPSSPLNSDSWFAKCILDSQNTYRAVAGLPGLEWDLGLAEYAFNWTLKMSVCGENLWEGQYFPKLSSGGINKPCDLAYIAVKLWWEEIGSYQYSKTGDWNACPTRGTRPIGHVTQMLWEKTKLMGCSYASCKSHNNVIPTVIVTCHYHPCGNIVGQPAFDESAWATLNNNPLVQLEYGGLPACDAEENTAERKRFMAWTQPLN